MLDLTEAQSEPVIKITKVNIKYLKIRVEKGVRNYACYFTYMGMTW